MSLYSYSKVFLRQASLFLLVTTLICSLSFGQSPKTQFKITGYTSQKSGKARLLLYTSQNQFIPFDSTDIKNGTFAFSGTLNEPKSFQLLIGNKGRILFVGNENLIVNDKNERTGAITVTGSKLSSDYDSYFNRWIAPLIGRLETINQRLDSLDATHQKEIDSLTLVQGSLFNHVADSSAVFISKNPSSFVSLYLLNYYSNSFTTETLTKLFNHLDKSLKRYPSTQLVKGKIQSGLQPATKCPSFSVADATGQPITLQSFKGTYLLIHFWAGWSEPCLKNLPFIQKAADRFQHQNFKVLTASLDNDTSVWKSAIETCHLNEHCKNVFLPGQFRNPVALQFGISLIPRTVLVDPDGNIIDTNIDGAKLGSRLEKIFSVSVNGDDDVALSQ